MKKTIAFIIVAALIIAAPTVIFATTASRPYAPSPENETPAVTGEVKPIFTSSQDTAKEAEAGADTMTIAEQAAQIRAECEADYEELREESVARYYELVKALDEFDAAHDLENLTEEEKVERIRMEDEILYLDHLYIHPSEVTDANRVESIIVGISELEREIDSYTEQLKTCSPEQAADWELEGMIAQLQAMVKALEGFKTRYESGEDPSVILKDYYSWLDEYYAKQPSDYLVG